MRTTRRVRTSGRAAVLLIAAVSGLLVLAGPAGAHATHVATEPGDGAAVEDAPREIVLTFNESMAQPSRVTVTDARGDVVLDDVPQIDGVEVRAPLTLPGPGSYQVEWRVVSADGHPIEGTSTFEVVEPVGVARSDGETSATGDDATDDGREGRDVDAGATDTAGAFDDRDATGSDEVGDTDVAAGDTAAPRASPSASTDGPPVLMLLGVGAAITMLVGTVVGSRMRRHRG